MAPSDDAMAPALTPAQEKSRAYAAKTATVLLGILIILVIILVLYQMTWLNPILPASYQKVSTSKQNFVGNFSDNEWNQGCMQFATKEGKIVMFNRCTYA